MTRALAVYGAALRRAATGRGPHLDLVRADGVALDRLYPAQWTGRLRPGDRGLLDRCAGATLDVGCGPGRLVAALRRAGCPALGVDVSPEAIRQTRRRGAPGLCRSVFQSLPGEGAWRHVLLADGNIGIGGDPARLLRRCARLLAPRGSVLVEVRAPDTPTWAAEVTLRDDRGRTAPVRWASVSVSGLAVAARGAGMRVHDTWTEADRWFACLVPG
jgi:SAM-dependent methyltransferase